MHEGCIGGRGAAWVQGVHVQRWVHACTCYDCIMCTVRSLRTTYALLPLLQLPSCADLTCPSHTCSCPALQSARHAADIRAARQH